MFKSINQYKQDLGFKWIKSESGNTYLCPVNLAKSELSEEELERYCVSESSNPENA